LRLLGQEVEAAAMAEQQAWWAVVEAAAAAMPRGFWMLFPAKLSPASSGLAALAAPETARRHQQQTDRRAARQASDRPSHVLVAQEAQEAPVFQGLEQSPGEQAEPPQHLLDCVDFAH
jgi:predicted phage tail protein